MSSTRILLASGNPHKHEEIARALGLPAAAVLRPQEIFGRGDPPEPVEDGATYRENAAIKARAFSAWASLPALADDSGLEVEALGGRPGVHSSRYAGEGATFAGNNQKLLAELEGIIPAARGARFICLLVLALGDRILLEIDGVCPGRVAETAAGAAGFGYDPIFVPAGENRTFAQMTASEKDAVSHRGRALRKLSKMIAAGTFALPSPAEPR